MNNNLLLEDCNRFWFNDFGIKGNFFLEKKMIKNNSFFQIVNNFIPTHTGFPGGINILSSLIGLSGIYNFLMYFSVLVTDPYIKK
jgi:hypothetical protein